MKVEQIYTGCLSQASYLIVSKGEAVVIDPLRDVDKYIKLPFSIMWSKLDYIKRNPSTALKFAMGLAFLGLGFLTFAYSINYIDGVCRLQL